MDFLQTVDRKLDQTFQTLFFWFVYNVTAINILRPNATNFSGNFDAIDLNKLSNKRDSLCSVYFQSEEFVMITGEDDRVKKKWKIN